jgi:hypothetical protein
MLLSITKSCINYQIQNYYFNKKKNKKNIILDDLPNEILYIILENIPREQDSNLKHVSKKWYKLIKKIRIANNCDNSNQTFIKYPLPLTKDICCIQQFKDCILNIQNINRTILIHNNQYAYYYVIDIIDNIYANITHMIDDYQLIGIQLTNENINDIHIAYNYVNKIKQTHKDQCFRCYKNEIISYQYIYKLMYDSLAGFGVQCIMFTYIYNKPLTKIYMSILVIDQICKNLLFDYYVKSNLNYTTLRINNMTKLIKYYRNHYIPHLHKFKLSLYN